MLLKTLAGISKAANSGEQLFSLGTDWLYPQKQT